MKMESHWVWQATLGMSAHESCCSFLVCGYIVYIDGNNMSRDERGNITWNVVHEHLDICTVHPLRLPCWNVCTPTGQSW